ncbi:MAG: ATP-binding protein [Eubacteriales bacterium]
MSNAILKSIYAANFGPFADRVDFTLEAERGRKEYLNNVFENENNTFDKVAYIYGGNGAGKSFFCKILKQIQDMIILSPILASGNAQLIDSEMFKGIIDTEPNFKYEFSYKDKPTLLGVCVVIEKTAYTYEFTMKNGVILTECLQKKYRRTETILDRTGSSYMDIRLKSELLSFQPNLKVVKNEVLCLSMASFLNNNLAMKLIAAIRSIPVLNMASLRVGMNIDEEAFNKERIEKYVKILQKADPTMRDLDVSFMEKKIEKQKFALDDFENKEIIMATAKLAVESTHNVFDKGEIVNSIKMPFLQTESSGTIKLFTVLPHLFNILEEGGTLILDEIENGLHPNLVRDLVKLFYDKDSNPFCAQLICTTHDVGLIENDVRRDQVWVVNKNEYGCSSINRVSSFLNIRNNTNLRQKYMDGAFGRLPIGFFEH